MRIRICAALVSMAFMISPAAGQGHFDLDRLDEKLSRYFERVMPGWKHERVEPFGNSENVLIQFWSSSNRRVKISVLPHGTGEEAHQALSEFMKSEWNKEPLRDLGDEAHAWGYGMSNVAFRKGRLTVYISTYAEVDSDPDARTLTQAQRFEREKSERRRLSIEFARHAASAINSP